MSELKGFKTPGGYYLLVDEHSLSCGVYRGEVENLSLEQVKASGVKVTGVAFLGTDVQPLVSAEGLSLFPVRSRLVSVPYRLADGEKKSLQLNVRVLTDQFPVYVRHFPEARAFLKDISVAEKSLYSIVFLGADVPRIDSMGVRVAFPHARVFQVRSAAEQERAIPVRVRAADLVDRPGMDHVSQNPVFMARVMLRRLDFSGMERLPLDYKLTKEDMEFIRAFLEVMFKNETKSPELAKHKEKVSMLRDLFRLIDLVVRQDREGLDREIEQGVGEGVVARFLPFLRKQRERASQREEEIALWELEYRLGEGR